ncbi:hypothetical protein OG618_37425 (plasmid) [Kitasatospora sp. NBC_01246]|uniref:hypothetical protein n=1 Tax=Kitasatospora sp. NBC_01246 TaxID=2903570 RepID=UPI002E2FAE7B|nr:hypothetical protein [Kitasatospora sp. NBC_01246]
MRRTPTPILLTVVLALAAVRLLQRARSQTSAARMDAAVARFEADLTARYVARTAGRTDPRELQ